MKKSDTKYEVCKKKKTVIIQLHDWKGRLPLYSQHDCYESHKYKPNDQS